MLEDFESPRREFGRRVAAPPLSSTAAGFSSLLSADTHCSNSLRSDSFYHESLRLRIRVH